MTNCSYFDKMKALCVANGFACKGKAFFRIFGDGVLQVLAYRKERHTMNPIIYVGLFSLYGEIRKQWVTSVGCIPRYAVYGLYCDWNEYICCLTNGPLVSKQIEVLENQGLPWLDTITTQAALAEAICRLDCARASDITLNSLSGSFNSVSTMSCASSIIWNDDLKIAPFIKSGQYDKAMQVVNAIRQQHLQAREGNREKMSPEEYSQHISKQDRINESLYRTLQMIEKNDMQEIKEYMDSNYENNCKLLRFAMKANKLTE